MSERFRGKVAVVTGAAGGIGRATAEQLGREGAALVLVDYAEGIAAVAEQIAAATGAEVEAIRADVSSEDEVGAFVARAVERFGGIDAFFNNAGIYGAPYPMPEYPVELFERIMSVNVVGVWLGMRAVMAAMAEKGGAIVNTSSIAGLRGYGNLSAYIASKHAVLGLTKVGAAEGGPHNIRVNAVCPGLIDTAMGDQVKAGMADFDEFMARVTPMGRVGTPAEVADSVCFLLSDEARFVSGAALTIDGGIAAVG